MIKIIGTILGNTGYDSHTRQLANALNNIDDVKLVTPIQPGEEFNLTDREIEMIKRKDECDINLIITNPIYWKNHIDNKRNWVYLVWEGDRIPKSFVNECLNKRIEYIIVPSEHTYKAIIRGFKEESIKEELYKNKIKIIPHGVDLNKFYPLSPKVISNSNTEKGLSFALPSLIPEDRFIFLANKGLRNLYDRGGIQYLIKAYLEEFTDKDNVELILKINPSYGIPNLLEMFPSIKEKNTPKISINTNILTTKQLNELYNKCHIFVSPTRAEAFNLPCLEAMACKKPIITTNFGGQTDFVDNLNGIIIGGKLEEVKNDVLYEGVKWLTPNIQELKKALRSSLESYKKTKEMGIQSLKKARKFTWRETAKSVYSLIDVPKI
ncbi:MAG: glycosyltransferase family 4 protein [Promethearchaeota archaeon]